MRLFFVWALRAGALMLAMASAASAGGGWYLMGPPTVVVKISTGEICSVAQCGEPVERQPNREVPLSRWDRHGAYDTASACESFKKQVFKSAREVGARDLIRDAIALECVAVDDPRLRQ